MNPGQLVLELLLVVIALVQSRSLAKTQHWRFVIGFAALAAAVNFVFYYIAVWPMYSARGLDRSVIISSIAYETVRWGVLAFVMCRLALLLQNDGLITGFALLQNSGRIGKVIAIGVAAGGVAAAAMYVLGFVEHHFGYLQSLPWPIANGEPVDFRLAIGGGFRNLVGEEVFIRLGAQSIALYALRRVRGGSVIALIVSALYFEIWHNPYQMPQFLNFTGSCVFGCVYQKYGYESAAIAHCVTDWLILGILPLLLFG